MTANVRIQEPRGTGCFLREELVATAHPVHDERVGEAFLAPSVLQGVELRPIPSAPVPLHLTSFMRSWKSA